MNVITCQPDMSLLSIDGEHARQKIARQFEAFGGSVTHFEDGFTELSIARMHPTLWGWKKLWAIETVTLDASGSIYQHDLVLAQTRQLGSRLYAGDYALFQLAEKDNSALALDAEAQAPVIMMKDSAQDNYKPSYVLYPPHPWSSTIEKFRDVQVYIYDSLVGWGCTPIPPQRAKQQCAFPGLV